MRGAETRLFLVRHGPTHARGMVGWTDLAADLSDAAALARLSEYLPPNALVVASDLRRAADTAAALANGRRRLPDLHGLREIHFGAWEMRTWQEVDAENPARIRAYWDAPGDNTPPGGESWHQTCARVNAAVDGLLAAHAGQDLIVVGHFGQILTQIQRAAGITALEAFGHKIDNLSVTELAFGPAGWRCGRINHRP
ncbi:histidine phosphatase family protein [Cribrihabitans neustonicus]|uniref:histidine phosphatase family protein n=1 Tax=Cribrihabitans neustonicus TaxID=1429085 RepID=UPI003B590593